MKPKVGRVPAAAFESHKESSLPRPRSAFLPRLLIASSCAVLFMGAAALSFNEGKGTFGRVSVADALASGFAPASVADAKHPSSVVIEEENGTIVGQLTKIAPPEGEQVTEIKTASTGGRSVREELLSIIGKY